MGQNMYGACAESEGVSGSTYKRQPTVSAHGYLWLVGVDEDLGMPRGTTTTIARDHSIVGPAHRLLVNEFDGGIGLRLLKQSRPVSMRL